jgi:hypothetical protein
MHYNLSERLDMLERQTSEINFSLLEDRIEKWQAAIEK